jgi:hypothetical protein
VTATSDIQRTVERLCELSRKTDANPYAQIEWAEVLEKEQWFTSPELISIEGTEAYDRLSERERKRLSFFEAVNFFSLNIHGEKALIEGLARRLYLKDNDAISPYLHHFLDEENQHMACFGGFCTRYAGKIYPDRKIAFPRKYADGEEDFLFFVKVLVFEEIVDVYNARMSRDARLVPLARAINLMHHRDETRHLAFGRKLVGEMFARCRERWSEATLRGVRETIGTYLVATWKEYFNPDVYRDAGFDEPYMVREQGLQHPRARERRREISRSCVRHLLGCGVLEEEPAL